MDTKQDEFLSNGRVWFRGFFNPDELSLIQNAVGEIKSIGQRNVVLDDRIISRLSQLTDFMSWEMQLRSATAFIKSVRKLWTLPWHQDRILPFYKNHGDKTYRNWTMKSEVWHCEPPEHILRKAAFAHILLDDVTLVSGPMEIALASQQNGCVSAGEIDEIIVRSETEPCIGLAGDVVLLQFLILHRSLANSSARTRHTLRVDFAPV